MNDTTRAGGRSADAVAAAPGSRGSALIKRLLPLGVLLAAVVAFFALGLHEHIDFETLRRNRRQLLGLVEAWPLLAPLAYVAAYALVVALSLPGAAVMTIAGGFLFGLWLGTACVVVGATLGATAVFLVARTALGDFLRARAGPWLRRMEDGFRENAFSYLLFLRLIPLFPFWLVNLVPAFLGVPPRTYVAATLLGIIPGSLVYASVGNGLGAVFDQGGTPDLGVIFRPAILGPILGLAVLALLPVVYRRYKARRAR
ncbi:MAG TPA: TVP38/TMEM64 family protein [Geminicoccaceae bacterium]|nr:TVP38/TMEM64 family protein [Geminicoccaceae bacterium]